jgi:chemotaxis protein MotB
MTLPRLAILCACCSIGLLGAGCQFDRVQQLETLNRNLNAEKAGLQQELYDLRSGAHIQTSRAESLEEQLATKEMLIASLQSENDGLEDKFSQLQKICENVANLPPPAIGMNALPPALDNALQQFAASYPEAIAYDPINGALKWKSDLLFALGSDIVKDSAKQSLQRFSEIMNSSAAKDFDLIVVGHTDNIRIARPETKAMHPTNMHLATHRSIAAFNTLRDSGVPAQRIGVMGFGEFRPIQSNDSEANRALNRRVEMYIVPKGMFSPGATPTSALAITGQGEVTK